MAISIVKNGIKFTPYRFYNDLLSDVSDFYSTNIADPVEFRLIDSSDEEAFWGNYRIDPITIPLLLSLSTQLKSVHNQPLKLHIFNNKGTNALLEFLSISNFFHIIGDNTNPLFPIGKKIFDFDNRYLGGFPGRKYRPEHKIRAYSKIDDKTIAGDKIEIILNSEKDDELKRDFLVEYYSYKTRDHFAELLFNNWHELTQPDLFIDVLSELISNGIMHSEADVFALMFVDRYSTRFSISDNGIGLTKSLEKKEYSKDLFYKQKELTRQLKSLNTSFQVPNQMKENLYAIFEALLYSMTKKRKGLFDLMCNVVLENNGRFRIHTEHSQVIISNKMNAYLCELNEMRHKILNSYFSQIKMQEETITQLTNETLKIFKEFYEYTINRYNEDIIYSSIRFNRVGFNGVHIEVEIPNNER